MYGSSLGALKLFMWVSLLAIGAVIITSLIGGQYILAGVSAIAFIAIGFSFNYVRRITKGLNQVVEFCRDIENGNFEIRMTHIHEGGELGEMLWALNGLVDRMDAFIREAMASMEYVRDNKFYRRILETGMVGTFLHAAQTINEATDAMEKVSNQLSQMADELEVTVGTGVGDIFKGADHILSRTKNMGTRIDKSSARSVDVAKAAQRTSDTVAKVADETEQLSASINEISNQVHQSTQISRQAVANAEEATVAVNGLNVAAQKIGEVVKLITDIAEQTNLLALNATIEAARAGEAGKGFAVVAGEVKNLANQTARATQEISQQIAGIQSATQAASDAISGTGNTIAQIDEIATLIASAVEEQGSSTQNIVHNMQEVSENSELVRSRIVKVNQGAATSYSAAIQVMWAARDLNKPAQELDEEVKKFLANLRSNNKTG